MLGLPKINYRISADIITFSQKVIMIYIGS